MTTFLRDVIDIPRQAGDEDYRLPGNLGAVIDGRPLPLAAPGQFFRLDSDWLNGQPRSSSGDTS